MLAYQMSLFVASLGHIELLSLSAECICHCTVHPQSHFRSQADSFLGSIWKDKILQLVFTNNNKVGATFLRGTRIRL